MNIAEHPCVLTKAPNRIEPQWAARSVKPSFLHMVSGSEVENLSQAISRAGLPGDLSAKLESLAREDLTCQFIEQNCRLFISLLLAAEQGNFKGANTSQRERLLRVLAYVRKDDDYTPDYCQNGFDDDRQEVRAAVNELHSLLQQFKAWHLRHQVATMWTASPDPRSAELRSA